MSRSLRVSAFSRPCGNAGTAEVQFFFTHAAGRVVIAPFGWPDSSMVEQLTFNQLVPGSSPGPATLNNPFYKPAGVSMN
jgi:hypothetical protein